MRTYLLGGRSTMLGLVTAMFLLLTSHAQAAVFSLTGSFTKDDDVVFIPFTLIANNVVTVRTFGYAGGKNAAGAIIPAGGFDPIVTLFRLPAGTLIGESDDGIGVPADPTTGEAGDSLLHLLLGPGSYTVALTEYDNFTNGNLSDGFFEAGNGNFTAAFGCGASSFCDPDGIHARTAKWAVDITVVPEPASVALLALGLAGLGAIMRRRKAV